MAESRVMVQIQGLEKFFGEDRERVHVLKGVSLDIPEGSLYTLLGPSGCGKTTTVRLMTGLLAPTSGDVSIGATPSVDLSSAQRARIGYFPQNPALFPDHGIALADKKLVVVKSAQHFHAGFAPLAKDVLWLDGPGALTQDFARLPYSRVRRPRAAAQSPSACLRWLPAAARP